MISAPRSRSAAIARSTPARTSGSKSPGAPSKYSCGKPTRSALDVARADTAAPSRRARSRRADRSRRSLRRSTRRLRPCARAARPDRATTRTRRRRSATPARTSASGRRRRRTRPVAGSSRRCRCRGSRRRAEPRPPPSCRPSCRPARASDPTDSSSAERAALGRRAHRELVAVDLAEHDRAGRAQLLDDGRVVRRDPAGEHLRAGGGRDALA